jgi:hypothetical protein
VLEFRYRVKGEGQTERQLPSYRAKLAGQREQTPAEEQLRHPPGQAVQVLFITIAKDDGQVDTQVD